MVTCHIGARGAVIARFSMRHPFVHSGSSWPNGNADVKTFLAGILTRLMPPLPVHIVPISNASFHCLKKTAPL